MYAKYGCYYQGTQEVPASTTAAAWKTLQLPAKGNVSAERTLSIHWTGIWSPHHDLSRRVQNADRHVWTTVQNLLGYANHLTSLRRERYAKSTEQSKYAWERPRPTVLSSPVYFHGIVRDLSHSVQIVNMLLGFSNGCTICHCPFIKYLNCGAVKEDMAVCLLDQLQEFINRLSLSLVAL